MSKTFQTFFFLLFAWAAVAVTLPAAAEPTEIKIGVTGNRAPLILQTMEQRPDVCDVDDYVSPDWDRFQLEFYFVCRAIRIGGYEASYTFHNYPNYARAKAEILNGTFMMMVDLPWSEFSENKESLYRSIPVLQEGEFEKGIYTRPDHKAVLEARTLEDLQKFSAVSTKTWPDDWTALERMNIRKLSVPLWTDQQRMLKAGRVDFMLEEFSAAEDLSYPFEDMRFVPVPGLKVVIRDSRRAVVSKKFPHSKAVFDALQIGLKNLHDRGLIIQGYNAIGFINPRVKDWQVLCCEVPRVRCCEQP